MAITYQEAGVDIDAGTALIERIKPLAAKTQTPLSIGTLGGFGGLIQLPIDRYRQPLLVTTTDGIGTKLLLLQQHQRFETIGHDVVAMCANDLLTLGAEPLCFLDYYACGTLILDQAEAIISGMSTACQTVGTTLSGGETAEMPGLYKTKEFDCAGFMVGIVEADQRIDGRSIAPGDALIALPSSGPHANGFALIRALLEQQPAPDLEALLKPTTLYTPCVTPCIEAQLIKGMAHITGGGLVDNIPRILPKQCTAHLALDSWTLPECFSWLKEGCALDTGTLLRTFNCGVGFILVVDSTHVNRVLDQLSTQQAWLIGQVMPSVPNTPRVQWT